MYIHMILAAKSYDVSKSIICAKTVWDTINNKKKPSNQFIYKQWGG